VWVGTTDGLLHVQPNGIVERITQETNAQGKTTGLPGNRISMVMSLADGHVLVGSSGQGLTRMHPQKRSFERLANNERFTAVCALVAPDGGLWVGTEGSGLMHIAGNSVERVQSTHGLLSDHVATLQLLDSTLWIGSNRGLNLLNLNTRKLLSYGRSEGFTGMEVKANASLKQVSADDQTSVWYGTVDGLMVHQPAKGPQMAQALATHLSTVRVNLEALPFSSARSLSYDENNVLFDYQAVSLGNPEAVRYEVRLDGLESSWRSTGKATFTNYPAIPPGQYTFMVRALGANSPPGPEAAFSFTIRPPFWQTWWFIGGCLLLVAGSIVLVVRLRERALKQEKERLERQVAERTAEVVQQKEALAEANEQLAEQHKDIVDSIRYAERIQRAILPLESTMQQYLADAFVLFQPKDIVSGDFYWFAQRGTRIYFSAIDCTGHGVPGAFVSLIGNNGLQKAVNELGLERPSEILDALRTFVVNVFQQQGAGDAIRDGMDMALCALDTSNGSLEFAGAKNPMYLLRQGEMEIIKADKMPVGASETDRYEPFTNHPFQLQKGDCVYLFSDGFADQFGGPKGKKFKYRPFQELLTQLCTEPMAQQKAVLERTINDWMRQEAAHYEQIDDILVMGIRY